MSWPFFVLKDIFESSRAMLSSKPFNVFGLKAIKRVRCISFDAHFFLSRKRCYNSSHRIEAISSAVPGSCPAKSLHGTPTAAMLSENFFIQFL